MRRIATINSTICVVALLLAGVAPVSASAQEAASGAVYYDQKVVRTGKGAAPVQAARAPEQQPFRTGVGGGYTAGSLKGKMAVQRWKAKALQARLIGAGNRVMADGSPMGGLGGTPPYVPTGGGYNMGGQMGGLGGTPPYMPNGGLGL